jgi:23S rRNA pseudouridine2605 synthase
VPPRRARPPAPHRADVSLPRALSKLGLCSRTQGERLVREGRVRVNGELERDPARRVDMRRDRIVLDDAAAAPVERVYLMLNKPRGLVTTRDDPQGRPTVYACLTDPGLPFVAPVGRLDRASEGLLLLTNDGRWAQRLLDPASHVPKTYHVQVDRVPDDDFLAALQAGVRAAEGDVLAARAARPLRSGGRTAWLEIELDEGRNRHIRRMLAALGAETLRLVRVSIGPLVLGDLPKGAVRALTPAEKRALDRAAGLARDGRDSRDG